MTFSFSTQDHLIHDLKAPLDVITRLQNNSQLGGEVKDQLSSCSNYIKEIIATYFTANKQFSKDLFISECVREKILLFEDIKFSFQNNAKIDEFIFLDIDQLKFNRILFNLISNASQALKENSKKEAKILISTHNDKDYYYLSLSDNGCGFPPHILEGTVFTSSEASCGIGLDSVTTILEESGGSIKIYNTPQGACIDLQIPIIFKDIDQVVLYEDQELFIRYWEKKAREENINLIVNPSNQPQGRSLYFVDVHLDGSCGLRLAQRLVKQTNAQVILTTNYPKSCLQEVEGIRGVIDKTPPFSYFSR